MNASVQGALEKAQAKLQAQEKAQREALALYFDLYTREYAPDGALTEEYCYYDGEEEPKRYFRKVAMPLTDEEFARLADMRAKLEATAPKTEAGEDDAPVRRKPILGQILYVVGIIGLFATAILAVTSWFTNTYLPFGIVGGLSMLVTGVGISLVFLGLGKGLILLTRIDQKTHPQEP